MSSMRFELAAARPPRPPRRVRQVLETAIVTGPEGQDVHVDAQGRIQVRFHWDLDASRGGGTSCWLRVVQPWAGAGWGCQMLPRIGMEVAVAFAGGDPDCPVVLGALPSPVHPPPFPLPRDGVRSGLRTRTAPGFGAGSELSFDDAAGYERVRFYAARDLEERVGADHTRDVRGSEIVTIEGDLVLNIHGRQIVRIGGRRPDGGDLDVFHDPEDEIVDEEDLVPADPPPAMPPPLPPMPPQPPPPPSLVRKVLWAEVVFRAAMLPPHLTPIGHAIWDRTDALATEAEQLAADVDALEAELSACAAQGGTTWHRGPAGRLIATRATILEERARRAQRAIGGALSEVGDDAAARATALEASEKVRERMAKLHRAADKRLRATLAEVDELAVRLHLAREATAADGVSPFFDARRRGGTSRGGGGGGPMKEHGAHALSFQSADESGKPRMIETRGGSILEIDGGGKIVAPDGFKIEAGGCTIEMAGGVVTITGAQVILKGNPVRVN